MKALSKASVLGGLILMTLGTVLACISLFAVDFDFHRFDNMKYTEHTTEITEGFSEVLIYSVECDVRILPAEGDVCTVTTHDGEKITHAVTVKDGFLTVKREDHRKWYERIGFFVGETREITVRLPKEGYYRFAIETTSGNITVEDGFSLKKAELRSTSGDVAFLSEVTESYYAYTVSGVQRTGEHPVGGKHFTAKSTSGDIFIPKLGGGDAILKTTSGDISVSASDAATLDVQTTSGDVSVSSCAGETLRIETTSGEIALSRVDLSRKAMIVTVSGDVSMELLDGAEIVIRTSSGDVEGTVASPKQYTVKTTSGDCRVPQSAVTEERCSITTVSGDVDVRCPEG